MKLITKCAAAAAVLAALFLALVWPLAGRADALPKPDSVHKDFAVTVFNDNLAMVKDTRVIRNVRNGTMPLEITGIPSRILADSVHFKDLGNAGLEVVEQNYEFDLADAGKILEKYKLSDPKKAQKITVVMKDATEATGVLMYFSRPTVNRYGRGGWTPTPTGPITIGLKMDDGSIRNLRGAEVKAVRLGRLPENLRTKPTLVWKLDAKLEKGNIRNAKAEISYLTEGMSWRADYRVMFTKKDRLDLSGWVTVNNFSGVTFKDAKLKLIAGDVHRVKEAKQIMLLENECCDKAEQKSAAPAPGFKEKSFAEYHLYTLGQRTTLKSSETKQIELINRKNVKWEKKYEYDANLNASRVLVLACFRNFENNNMGMALPKGRVRMFAQDVKNETEFAGEDSIDHTPKDEELRLRMGWAFDVVAERKVLEQTWPNSNRPGYMKVRLVFRNHKEHAVEIDAFEHLWGGYNADVLKNTHEYRIKDAYTLHFPVKIEADAEVKIEYRVRYSYMR